jgi:ABC-2 type transport system ATP-binding protein
VSAALRVSALGKSFGAVTALRDVSFQAVPGELLALLGPNGAGKTTLLSAIAGALRPDAGSVSAEGAQVGWAPQRPALYGRLTVAENLALFARLEGVPDVENAVSAMLEQTGLRERSGELVERLSGGNRQRVNVALALVGDPPVLALDEPTASLDPAQRARLWRFLRSLAAEQRTIVLSTHDVSDAQRYADRVLVLDGGEVVFDGLPAELLARAGASEGTLDAALLALLAGAQHGEAGAGA